MLSAGLLHCNRKYYRGRKINKGSGNRSRVGDRVNRSDTETGGKGELDWIGNR